MKFPNILKEKKYLYLIVLICVFALFASSFTIHVVSNVGLQIEYPFDGDVLDSSVNGNDATNSGASFLTENCVDGQCLSFDGINDYLDTDYVGDCDSIVFDFKTSDTLTSIYLVGQRWDSSEHDGAWNVQVSSSDNSIDFAISEGSNNIVHLNSGDVTISPDVWYNVAFTTGSSGHKLYIDGVLVASDIDTTIPSGNSDVDHKLQIGRYGLNDEWKVGGHKVIDNFRVFNRELSSFEVLAFSLGKPSGTEATCEDSVQNGDETGVDCGGSCEALCPSPDVTGGSTSLPTDSCYDGIKNGDETGVDCGGSCNSCYYKYGLNDVQDAHEDGLNCVFKQEGYEGYPLCKSWKTGFLNNSMIEGLIAFWNLFLKGVGIL